MSEETTPIVEEAKLTPEEMRKQLAEAEERLAEKLKEDARAAQEAAAQLERDQHAKLKEWNEKHNPEPRKIMLTFAVPAVLIAQEGESFTMRRGGRIQLEHEIVESYSFEQEKDFPMGIQRLSLFNLMGGMMRVLDEVSVPTAKDYLSMLGQRVLWKFSSTEIPSEKGQISYELQRPVFHNHRVYVVLPESVK